MTGTTKSVEAFPVGVLELKSNGILWLSDLHFASTKGIHGFAGELEEESLLEKIKSVIAQQVKHSRVDGMIVSGDLSWAADREEFRSARGFIRQVLGHLDNASHTDRLVLCPGNHDLPFAKSSKNNTGVVPPVISSLSRREYAAFYRAIFGSKANAFLNCGRRYKLENGTRLDLACLNSSVLQQFQNSKKGAKKKGKKGKTGVRFQGHGWIGEGQLTDVADQMGWESGQKDAARLVVVHHNPLPVNGYERPEVGGSYSMLLDAERFLGWVAKHRIDAVLHGHTHTPFLAFLRRGVKGDDKKSDHRGFAVCGLGSSGVGHDHRPQTMPNNAATLEISAKTIDVRLWQFTNETPVEVRRTWRIPWSL